MNQTWENDEKPNFEPTFGPFGQTSSPLPPSPPSFLWILCLLVARHCSKLSFYAIWKKTNESTWENGEKPKFGPNFDQNLGPKNSFREFYLY